MDDWKYYQAVNLKFADALLEEMGDVEKPIVLVQDYHFALLPRMIKEKRPEARVAIFWHIPWPTPEAFDISPWRRELVGGLLGADLIGFHIQAHCNNFLHTVDRVVESRVDWAHFSVRRLDHLTLVRPFPISVDLADVKQPESTPGSYAERSALLRDLGVEATFMGVGVDRVDYTKGILECFLAIERFLEKYASYQGKFTFVQIGAPSRSHLKRYHDLMEEVEAEANRIKRKLGFHLSEITVSRWLRRIPRTPDPAKRWLTFLRNHREAIAAMDFFTVPTLTFGVLYCFFVIGHDRRKILRFNVTRNPNTIWIVQQIREAWPYVPAHRFLLFDHDSKFGTDVISAVRDLGSQPIRTAFRSPWQNGVAERWVGSC